MLVCFVGVAYSSGLHIISSLHCKLRTVMMTHFIPMALHAWHEGNMCPHTLMVLFTCYYVCVDGSIPFWCDLTHISSHTIDWYLSMCHVTHTSTIAWTHEVGVTQGMTCHHPKYHLYTSFTSCSWSYHGVGTYRSRWCRCHGHGWRCDKVRSQMTILYASTVRSGGSDHTMKPS